MLPKQPFKSWAIKSLLIYTKEYIVTNIGIYVEYVDIFG